MVLVHLSEDIIQGLKGNKLSPMPGIVVSVWENEYSHHPLNPVGVNVRVFTDSNDTPLWLTSLPMNFDGAKEMFGNSCSFFEKIG